ncbi:TylF/MycF family methyltransferase [Amycolatopsis magusensis]|uniref:TylF/MycF family methyltransferase n=1 Tax=Amycolatopsis magusensis TaxID=882444 RepID=UPI0024A82B0B|nr:TylF/MycF family methyltransferase [Amycolatopsis magusensis]MDI5980592.1 TylF/MycF family methyltransferase [Amycolatopsis magusensis]
MTDHYLNLMKRVLTGTIHRDGAIPSHLSPGAEFDPDTREIGGDWPRMAHTMVGLRRLDNVHECLDRAVADGVPGDFVETGVWRGGVCIFARAYFAAHGITDRRVWVADSFQGIPPTADGAHPVDRVMRLDAANDVLGVPLAEVRANFAEYDLLDDQVRFLPGWFADTLPTAPVERIAVLRLDGDLYESTMDALTHLFPKLSPGGFVIVDDYHAIQSCRDAVHEYRDRHGITAEIHRIDHMGAYWRRPGATGGDPGRETTKKASATSVPS